MQKQEIIKKVTDAIVSVEGEGLQPVTWVLIEDVNSGEWGIGGIYSANNPGISEYFRWQFKVRAICQI